MVNSVGRRSSEAALDQNAVPNTMSAFSYDPVGRLAVLTSCLNVTCTANLLSMKYQYDLLGDETDRNLNGSDFASVYDTAGRLTSFSKTTFTSPTNPGNLLSAVSYDAFGHMVFATFANGLSQSWAFDKRGRPTSMASGTTCAAGSCATTVYRYTPSYAPDGNVFTANDTANGNWNYSYDQFNRLVCSNLATNGNCASPTNGKPTYSYVYDRFANRWQQNGPNGPNSFLATFTGNNPGAPATTTGWTATLTTLRGTCSVTAATATPTMPRIASIPWVDRLAPSTSTTPKAAAWRGPSMGPSRTIIITTGKAT
jgi:YD repeat-containing protein